MKFITDKNSSPNTAWERFSQTTKDSVGPLADLVILLGTLCAGGPGVLNNLLLLVAAHRKYAVVLLLDPFDHPEAIQH